MAKPSPSSGTQEETAGPALVGPGLGVSLASDPPTNMPPGQPEPQALPTQLPPAAAVPQGGLPAGLPAEIAPVASSLPSTDAVSEGLLNEGSGKPGGQHLEGAQTPQITIEKTAPQAMQVGMIRVIPKIVWSTLISRPLASSAFNGAV